MKLLKSAGTALGAVAALVPRPDELKSAVVRAPIFALNSALKGAEVAARGYDELTRRGEKVIGVVRELVEMGKEAARPEKARPEKARPDSAAPSEGPTTDPWTGGPIEPPDDIRAAVFLPEDDAEAVEEALPGDLLSHDELPLEDYDHLTIGELRARIRKLEPAELVQLREYEQAHANRLVVIKAFDNRLTALAKQSSVHGG